MIVTAFVSLQWPLDAGQLAVFCSLHGLDPQHYRDRTLSQWFELLLFTEALSVLAGVEVLLGLTQAEAITWVPPFAPDDDPTAPGRLHRYRAHLARLGWHHWWLSDLDRAALLRQWRRKKAA